MATNSDSDEDETFVTLGTPLEIPNDDEPRKKPVQLEDQQATDSKGRVRFHGAFTGGFSAGYFNTVGSKEGWTPSTFVSSRDKRHDDKTEQRPENFMDEEDMGEYGIAPRKYVTGSQFASEERKKRQLDEVQKVTEDSILAGQSALMDLIVPERITIGVKLLRKMGWKEGQGVGPRLSQKQKKRSAQKTYGCALLPSRDSDDDLDDEAVLKDVTFAPKDSAHILMSAKDNTKGLGYVGLDPRKALPSSHINLFGPPKITKGGPGRKGIRGQAFGVGALEDDDDEIYTVDSMSNYDMTMGDEESDDHFGWTRPSGKRQGKTPVDYVGSVLEGFTLSASKLVQKKDFPPPKLPRDFRPLHRFSKKAESLNLGILSTQTNEGVDYRQLLKPADDSQNAVPGYHGDAAGTQSMPADNKKHYSDASSRSIALGEKPFVGSVFDLMSNEDKSRMEKAKKGELVEPEQSTSQQPTQQGTIAVASPAGSNVPADMPHPQKSVEPETNEEQRTQNIPLFQGGFKPFHKNPAKQQRYEKYLEAANLGNKDPYSAAVTSDLTAWEVEHEKEEFNQAYKLYRPLAGMMAMRFTRGGNVDDDVKSDVRMPDSIDTSDAGRAAAMKMYGKLTREIQEWHPDQLVCKRFNVPNPYPGSTIVGLATVKRDKYSVFNFLNFANPTQHENDQREASTHQIHTENPNAEPTPTSQSDNKVEKELNKGKVMKSIFSHLIDGGNDKQKSIKPVSFKVKSAQLDKSKEFKSIFSHLESGENTVKPSTDIAMETEPAENVPDVTKYVEKDKLTVTSCQKKEGEPAIDLFRAIFRNTDSEDSSNSEEEEEMPVVKDSSIQHEVKKESLPKKMDTMPVGDNPSGNKDEDVGTLPGNGQPMESLSDRLSPTNVDSGDSDSYGPPLPPQPTSGERMTASGMPVKTTDDRSKQSTADYIDLTKSSSRKHKHKDRHKHKSKKDKKEKHKKSKHKKKNKKKEKKNKYESDSSEGYTTDKDSDDDTGATDREILKKLKSIRASKQF